MEREVLFQEEFDEMGAWEFDIDTSNREDIWSGLEDSYSEINDGKLTLFANNNDVCEAILIPDGVDFSTQNYIGIEIRFENYYMSDHEYTSGKMATFSFGFGDSRVIDLKVGELSLSPGTIHILMNRTREKVFVTVGSDEYVEAKYFTYASNSTIDNKIRFTANTYWPDVTILGPQPGNLVIERFEIYTLMGVE